MTARPRSCFDVSQDLVCVVGLIGRHTPGAGRVRSFKQRAGLSAVVSLAAGQHPPAQVAQPLDQSVNLRRQAASRAPNGLVPFFWGRPPHVGARELWCYRGRVPQDRHLGPIRKDCSPHSAICQPGEAAIHAVPAAEPWGQVAPRSACPGHPENGLNEQPVISGCPPRVRWFARQ